MPDLPNCPKCDSEYTYEDMHLLVCPECAHEWTLEGQQEKEEAEAEASIIRDANGNELSDGDTVSIVKDLKVKGSSDPIKMGTTVKNIKLTDGANDGHDIACKVDGFGSMELKSEFVKKI